ncbi:hypothetical protein B0H17DRAFT_930971 [Mycena rosella]|uniref:Post-SET domain-containing protein n=1 Tax=Mycena rosella TaxID=1033263 RepID=A0AAD7DMQ8_MYCRO|nr:hypothetical protein B0H17DRAFT_930971 [Mycena rosella]
MTVPYIPSHADFVVEFKPGDFASFLRAGRHFGQGDTLAVLNKATRSDKAYSTVQCGKESKDNIELNSDLVYVNHSCEPNVVFDLSSADRANWHVRALKDIDAGSPLTFFYPSTEWEMEQPFECQCGTKSCLGRIQGAKFLTRDEVVERGWVSPWIEELISEREEESACT